MLLAKADPQTQRNAVPTLLAALRGARSNPDRVSLIQALGRIGRPAGAAAGALVEALRDRDKAVRSAAATALKSIRQ